MAKIVYIESDHTEHAIDVPNGYSLMEGAIKNGVPGIVAECGGGLACATCHIYISAPWKDKLNPPEEDELAMIEFASAVTEDSRLACQIEVGPELDGMVVEIADNQS